jgi:hypothetical protein
MLGQGQPQATGTGYKKTGKLSGTLLHIAQTQPLPAKRIPKEFNLSAPTQLLTPIASSLQTAKVLPKA